MTTFTDPAYFAADAVVEWTKTGLDVLVAYPITTYAEPRAVLAVVGDDQRAEVFELREGQAPVVHRETATGAAMLAADAVILAGELAGWNR